MKKSRHSEEKVITAVKQMEGGRKTADVARELGVSAATLYAWKGKYGGLQVSEAKRLRQLEPGYSATNLWLLVRRHVDGQSAAHREPRRPI